MFKKISVLFGDKSSLLYKMAIAKAVESFFLSIGFALIYFTIKNLLANTLSQELALSYLLGFFASIILAYLVNNLNKYRYQVKTYSIFALERIKIANHIRKLPMGFFNKSSAGALSNTLSESVHTIEPVMYVYSKILSLISYIIMFLMMSFFLDWRMAIAMFVGVPLAFYILFKDIDMTEKSLVDRQHMQGQVSEATVEFVSGIKEAKTFGKGMRSLKKYEQAASNFKEQNLKIEKLAIPKVVGYQLSVHVGFLPVMVLGAYLLIIKGELNLPIYLLFLLATLKLYISLQEVAGDIILIKNVSAGLTSINNIYENEPLMEASENKKITKYDIEFRNVSFAYEKEQVLKNINFHAQSNTITALMGPSGSGKTTVTNLIARFWDIKEGEIRIGGTNIKDFKTSELLAHISMVFQNVYLFNDTILNNIKMGDQKATEEEIIAASKEANCHDFIMKLPEKYETLVGEGGGRLSGGEKQRISIARAFLKNSPIVLLDEATANIDPENELIIQSSINKLVKNKTVIIIAHKVATIKSANQILVFDKGEIVQRGTHAELGKITGGIYNDYRLRRQRARGWKITN